jgi:CheY-like chemotaxis protein
VSARPPAAALQVMEAATDLMAMKDVAGVFVAANRAFRHAAALTGEHVAAITNGEVFEPEAATRLTATERLAVLVGQPVSCEVEVRWRGRAQTLHAVCTPWHEGGRCRGVLLTGQLATRGDAARLEMLATNVGELAHTFNNALTTVVGLTDWHLVAGEPAPALRADLERIRDAASAAERTAREIQQLSRSVAEGRFDRGLSTSRRSTDTPEPEAMRRPSVLIVDDQADVRASLAVMVRTLGYDVQSVESGAAALEYVAREPVDVVISDLGTSVTGGIALAARLQDMAPRLPLVLLSGRAPGSVEPPPAGIARVIGKPLRMAALREALAALLPPPA